MIAYDPTPFNTSHRFFYFTKHFNNHEFCHSISLFETASLSPACFSHLKTKHHRKKYYLHNSYNKILIGISDCLSSQPFISIIKILFYYLFTGIESDMQEVLQFNWKHGRPLNSLVHVHVLSHSAMFNSLWPSWTVACWAPQPMAILQARILEWVAMHTSKGYSNLGFEPRSLALQVDSLLSEPQRSPRILEWVAYLFLLQVNFLTQKSNHRLLHCRQILFFTSWANREASRITPPKRNPEAWLSDILHIWLLREKTHIQREEERLRYNLTINPALAQQTIKKALTTNAFSPNSEGLGPKVYYSKF